MTVEWTAARVDDLHELCAAALPDEHLTAAELRACCFEDGAVLGDGEGRGAVCVWQSPSIPSIAVAKLLVVAPEHQGRGVGRALLDAACDHARAAGASTIGLGASAPFYLWPGVDVHATRMLALAESTGFSARGAELNMSCPTTYRAAIPDGCTIERVLDADREGILVGWCARIWPHWEAELVRALRSASGLSAWSAAGEPVGFACHSVNRAGWFGPTGTDPAHRGRGIGAALLGAVCDDLRASGHHAAEIAWVGPIAFYAKTAGATVSRVFRTYARVL